MQTVIRIATKIYSSVPWPIANRQVNLFGSFSAKLLSDKQKQTGKQRGGGNKNVVTQIAHRCNELVYNCCTFTITLTSTKLATHSTSTFAIFVVQISLYPLGTLLVQYCAWRRSTSLLRLKTVEPSSSVWYWDILCPGFTSSDSDIQGRFCVMRTMRRIGPPTANFKWPPNCGHQIFCLFRSCHAHSPQSGVHLKG